MPPGPGHVSASAAMPGDLQPYFAGAGDGTATGIAFLDAEGRYVFISEGLAMMNGVAAADHLGRTVEEILPEVWPQIRGVLARVLDGEAVTCEFRASTAADDGRVHDWLEYWSPARAEGRVIGAAVTVVDVTELRASQRRQRDLTSRQAALRELAQRALADEPEEEVLAAALDALREHLDLPLVRVTRIVTGADRLQVIAGVGWDPSIIAQVPAGPRAGSLADFVLRRGAAVQFDDLANETRFRHPRLFLAHGIVSGIASPICMGDRQWGVLAGYERRHRRFDADDESFVDEMAAILGLMVQERESRAFREEILSMASHEIRTPLTSVIGLAQHIRRRVQHGRIEDAMELVDPLVAEAFRVDRVLAQWHDLAAAESHRVVFGAEPLDVTRIVADRAGEFQARHPEVTVHHDHGHGIPTIESDATRIAEILDNLLENARKYAATDVDLSVEAAEAGVRVHCRDYGPGISPEMVHRIFDRFFRGPERTGHGGMGLGLYISRKLAEGLGGTLEVTSAPGGGACFTLALPLVQPRPARRAPRA